MKSITYSSLLCSLLWIAGCAQGIEPLAEGDVRKFYIENLRQESFRGEGIKIIKKIEEAAGFTRYLIEYESQGLRISGMMNVPTGEGPFPAVILNHGFYGRRMFTPGLGFKDAADIFAKNGYVAVGSDFRNNGHSDKGDNFFQHFGYLYDVLYLTEAVRELPYVDRHRVGMWGYSLGGWLTLKAIVVDRGIQAAAIFGSMSADDKDNYGAMNQWHPKALRDINETIGSPETNPDVYARLSPLTYTKDMPDYVIIHHGEKDEKIPVAWSEKLRDALLGQGKKVDLYNYPGQGHVLKGSAWRLSMRRTIKFFDIYLKNRVEG